MDTEARRNLFHGHLARHFPAVYNYMLRLVHNASQAEDLAQEAFLKAWQAFDRYDAKRPFFPWIVQIARRTALDYLRRRHENQNEEVLQTIASRELDPEQQMLRTEQQQTLEASLQALPEVERTVVFLYYVEDLSISELAVILKKSTSNIAVILHRARQKLKKILEAQSYNPPHS